jgi:putative GTP pyrophosphokinase
VNDRPGLTSRENPDRTKLKEIYDELYPVYDGILQSLRRQVRQLLDANRSFFAIKSRVKHFDAYFDKLIKISRHERASERAAITDMMGLRIVCPFLEDLKIVENLIRSSFKVLELERKGSRHAIGEFGYESIHLLIKADPVCHGRGLPHTQDVCEVQLRTILQDAWAEVEHELIYKSDITMPNESIRRKLASLNATLTLSDLIFQELRDYQKDIRRRGKKRRESLDNKFTELPEITEALKAPSEADRLSVSEDEVAEAIAGKNLEKALLAALTAHSGGQLKTAVEIYSSVLRLKMTTVIRSLVYNHRGMAYFALSDYTRAVRDFSKSIKCDPLNVRSYNNRALAFRVLKRFDRSLTDYDRSVALDPSQFDGFWGRAQTLYEMKLYTRALADCKKILGMRSDFEAARSLTKIISKLVF